MPVEFICDGCGVKASGSSNSIGNWFKPSKWYQRTDKETKETYLACSRECIEKVAEKTGSHTVVLPF